MDFPLHIEMLLFLLACLQCGGLVRGAMYTAGVVEFAPDTLQPSDTPQELIHRNAHRYVDIIKEAATHAVNILVFPECGLTSINIPPVRADILPYLTEIPDVGANPCDLPEAAEVLKILSCAAKKYNIYVVYNLDELVHCQSEEKDCPSDGSLFYNTNVAINRDGEIVAKYRKFNLFAEPQFNVTKAPEHIWFDTDFGVRFGLFICFDILFKEPAVPLIKKHNISNFIFPAAWHSELPLLSAVSVQAGWAYEHDVNLLASGYSNVANRNGGSGIYAGRDGRLITTMPEHSSTKLLIARISADQRGVKPTATEEISFSEDENSVWEFFHDNLTDFRSTVIATPPLTQLRYEKEAFSCTIHVETPTVEEGPVYRLIAFTGLRSYGPDRTVHIEVCGIVACANSKLSSCNQKLSFHSAGTVFSNVDITLSSNKSLLSFPITLGENLQSLPKGSFQYKAERIRGIDYIELTASGPLNNFLTLAVFRNV